MTIEEAYRECLVQSAALARRERGYVGTTVRMRARGVQAWRFHKALRAYGEAALEEAAMWIIDKAAEDGIRAKIAALGGKDGA